MADNLARTRTFAPEDGEGAIRKLYENQELTPQLSHYSNQSGILDESHIHSAAGRSAAEYKGGGAELGFATVKSIDDTAEAIVRAQQGSRAHTMYTLQEMLKKGEKAEEVAQYFLKIGIEKMNFHLIKTLISDDHEIAGILIKFFDLTKK